MSKKHDFRKSLQITAAAALVTAALYPAAEANAFEQLQRYCTASWRNAGIADAEWEWALAFVTTGGKALKAYPNYRKAEIVDDQLTVRDKRHIQLHRMSIGPQGFADFVATLRVILEHHDPPIRHGIVWYTHTVSPHCTGQAGRSRSNLTWGCC